MMKVLSKLKSAPGLWMDEEPIPVPTEDEVLIKIRKTAICGTDLHIYKWDEWARKTIKVPMRTGHEFVGEIVELGARAKDLKIGDRVSGEGHIVCGRCRNCRAGQQVLCPNTEGIGVNRPGAFAEYFTMPWVNVCKVPDNISDENASILDPFGNAVHTALTFDVVGEDVLITGAGPVGLMAAAIVRHVGARHVVVTDVNEYRLRLAHHFPGITLAVNPQKTPLTHVMKELGMQEGFDVGLEMTGNSHAFAGMLEVMSNGGRIAFLGIPPEPITVDWTHVIFKSLTIQGIYGRRMFETWYKGMAMLQSGLEITPIVTHQFPVDDFQKGFDVMLLGESGKVILNW